MTIYEVKLFKLPIDRNYTNVFDYTNPINKTKYDLNMSINQIYSDKSLRIYTNNDINKLKSFNANKTTTLTIDLDVANIGRYIESNIYEYNYCIIQTQTDDSSGNNDYLFYFITDYSINSTKISGDGIEPINTNITLSLIWDSWNNNIEKIPEYDNNNFITRRHLDDYKLENNTFYTKNVISDENEITTFSTKSYENGIKPFKILYARLWFDNEVEMWGINFVGYAKSAMPSLKPLNIIYVPLCVMDGYDREIYTDITHYLSDKYPLDNSYEFLYTTMGLTYSNSILSSHLLYTDLTFHAPFDFTYGRYLIDGVEKTCILFKDNEMVRINEKSGNFICYGLGNVSKNIETKYFEIQNSYNLHAYGEYGSAYYTKNNSYKYEIEPRINQYPYTYKSFFVNGETIDIIPYYTETIGSKYIINLKYGNHRNAKYVLKRSVQESQIPTIYTPIMNNGSVVNVVSSLSEYLRNEGETMKNELNYKLTRHALSQIGNSFKMAEGAAGVFAGNPSSVGTLTSGIMGTASNIVETAYTIDSLKSKLKDINNSQDNASIPVVSALDDIEIQDDIYLIDNTISSKVDKEHLYNFFNQFGYKYKRMGKVNENTRLNFDYVQTENCSLPKITNEIDRNIIQNIFNNGVRKWHLDTAYPQAIKNFDYEYQNLPHSLNNYYKWTADGGI